MDTLLHALTAPWPWYVAGPILGLMVPAVAMPWPDQYKRCDSGPLGQVPGYSGR